MGHTLEQRERCGSGRPDTGHPPQWRHLLEIVRQDHLMRSTSQKRETQGGGGTNTETEAHGPLTGPPASSRQTTGGGTEDSQPQASE